MGGKIVTRRDFTPVLSSGSERRSALLACGFDMRGNL